MKEIKKFSTDLETGKYLFFGHEIDVISVYHKPYAEDTGKHTWIKCSFVDKTGNNAKVDTTADIIKKMLGIATKDYDTTNSKKTTKVLSAEELEERIADKTQKMCAPFVKYVGDSRDNIDCDKVHEMYLTIENSIRALCEYIETTENEDRRIKATEETTKKVTDKLQGLDLSLLSEEMKEQLRKQLGL